MPLSAVANVQFGTGPAQINRYDRSRQISIGGNLQGITLGQGLEAVDQLPRHAEPSPQRDATTLW